MTTPIRTCSHCGCTAENLIEFHDRLLCPDCLEEMTEVCVDCGTRFWNRECLTNDHGGPICPDCCDHNYTRCTRCGRTGSVEQPTSSTLNRPPRCAKSSNYMPAAWGTKGYALN